MDGRVRSAHINGRILQAMSDIPDCHLKILWRSFWSTCGEPMRMAWTKSPQATGVELAEQRELLNSFGEEMTEQRDILNAILEKVSQW